MPQGKNKKLLTKRIRKGRKGYPVATVAFYGPTNEKATKLVCAIIRAADEEASEMKKWFSNADVRESEKITGEVLEFIASRGAKTVASTDAVIGCPHEEGIDYEGKYCPECDYWKGRDRFTHHRIH